MYFDLKSQEKKNVMGVRSVAKMHVRTHAPYIIIIVFSRDFGLELGI